MGTPWWQHLCCTVVTRHVWQPWVPHVNRVRHWNCTGVPALGCSWLPVLLAALFEGGGSLLPADLIICAISGWLCFSSRISVISQVNAAGSSTNALASASGLSRTMARSISPPSFWMRAGRPACICARIATALFSHRVRFHSSRALCAKVPVCGGTVLFFW